MRNQIACGVHLSVLLSLSLLACGSTPRATGARGASAAAGGKAVSAPVEQAAAGTEAAGAPAPSTQATDPLLRPPATAGAAADSGKADDPPRTPDNDGYSVADGDCDDFADLINPGAYDVPGNGIDEDCQGGDAVSDSCDEMLAIATNDPKEAARALELCQMATETDRRWGVISARWTTPDGKGEPGSPLMHGVLPSLGSSYTPRAGKSLLALSSGVARASGQAGATRNCSDELPAKSKGLPTGFSGKSTSCEDADEVTTIEDAIALEVKLRVPSNATSISFDSAFFTDEYPDFICTPFNDFFQVLIDPLRPGGSKDGNVVFDQDGNAVSVNNSLLRVCEPGEHGGKTFSCPLGTSSLAGTGVDDCMGSLLVPGGLSGAFGKRGSYGASTGWLNTEVAVMPGEVITLRFMIWDSGDSALDSIAIIDHVHFRLRSEPPPPERPKTTPITPS